MEKSTEKRLEEAKKIEAEIKRSLDVVEMKKAHCQIEEVEKSRKKPSIASIIERIDFFCEINLSIYKKLDEIQSSNPKTANVLLPENVLNESGLYSQTIAYESIRFDFLKTTELKNEEFDKLFPKLPFQFNTLSNITSSLLAMGRQMLDIKIYCKRLI